jgi:GT2 family glycosyltransferase
MSEGYDIVGCEAWKMFPPNKLFPNDSGGVIMMGNTAIKDKSYYPHKRCTNKHDKFTYIGCGGMLIKREVYEKIGLFDERFSVFYFEDPDFAFRSMQAGFKLGWCPECDIVHLAHQTIGNQKMFDKQKQFLQSWNRFKEKWNGWFPDTDTDRRKK